MANKNVPVYRFSWEHAQRNGELSLFRSSVKANIKCKEAIEMAIVDGCQWHSENSGICRFDADDTARKIIEEYGLERTVYVTVNTINQKDYDGRIAPENKAWAKTIPIFEDLADRGPHFDRSFSIDRGHAVLTDAFVSAVRHIYNHQ